MEKEPHQLAEDGKRAFAAGRFAAAAESFRQASRAFTLGRDGLHAAEMNNNLSVALLKNRQPLEALQAALGTDKTFAGSGDKSRQAMALGNQAAALEDLKQYEEALALYEQAAALFAESGQGDMRSLVLKSMAGIRLKQGKFDSAGIEMLGSLGAAQQPSLAQRFTKFLLRFIK